MLTISLIRILARLVKIDYSDELEIPLSYKPNLKDMDKLKNELIVLIQLGYEYEVQMNIGNGWEPYEGCQQNLVMILEDPDTLVCIVGKETSEYYVDGKIRYNITLPSWWRKGSIAVIFDQLELEG